MKASATVRRYVAQRASAALLAVMVSVHLALIIYAVKDGLSAEEILSRTRGSWGWGTFYGLFVMTAAVHAGIGVRVIAGETTGLGEKALDLVMAAVALALASLGGFAVLAVVSA